MTLHVLNDVANEAVSTQNIDHYVQLGKLINGIPGSDLLISSLTG